MDTLNLILMLASLVGYGIFSACKDASAFQAGNLRFEPWWGGDSKFIWSSDTWHKFKHCEQFFLHSAVFWATGLTWYWFPLWALASSAIVGRSFVLFYHTLLLKEPDQSVWEWIKGTFLLWSDNK